MPAAGLLLTGGASRRMGQHKAALPAIDTGESLAGRTARLLAAATGPTIEIGPGWTDLPAIVELQRGGGPLVAIAAGRRELSARGWDGPAVVVATDLPRLTLDLLSWLAEYPSLTSVIPVALGVPQPLCARYTVRDLDRAVVLVAMGRRSMRDLVDGSDALLVGPEEWQPAAGHPDALDDVDTPADRARLGPARMTAAPRPPRPLTTVRAIKVRPDHRVELPEHLATEEPLEIRAAGPGQVAVPVAVTMRTPGHDFELAAGFLVTEGLVRPADITAVGYCDAVTDPEGRFNTVTVQLGRGWTPEAPARPLPVGSSCGICGKASIDQVELTCEVVGPADPLPASLIPQLPDRLRRSQAVFERTGGLHAAGLFDPCGEPWCVREDVGRHNVVDKVAGHAVLNDRELLLPWAGWVLMVSGRISFEIVQKAAVCGIGVIAAVSAPSSLAVATADRLGIAVAGFVRDGSFNVYSHPERFDLDG